MKSFGNIAKDGQVRAVASGALTDGKAVIVNSNGTVSVVASTGSATQALGSGVVFETAQVSETQSAYDTTNNKVVIAYRDGGNSNYGTAVVGTVSGTSISFGSPSTFNTSGYTADISIAFDATAGKFVISYRDNGNNNYGTAIVGTVSGTSISFGTEVVFKSNQCQYTSLVYDSNAGKVVLTYLDDGSPQKGAANVCTISGTSISFGSQTVFESAQIRYTKAAYDANAQKIVVAYRDMGNSNYGTAVVGTVSGTSISFGTPVVYYEGNVLFLANAYDSVAQKVVISYRDNDNSSYGTAVVGTVSGTSISFGTPVVFQSSIAQRANSTFDATAQKIVTVYQANPDHGFVVSGKVSGTTITFDTAVEFDGDESVDMSAVYDPDTGKVVIAYRDEGNSQYGTAIVSTTGYNNTNLTSENFIGFSDGAYATTQSAAINTTNTIDRNQSGLTAGQTYFVQGDGTLALTAADPSVTAGTAISATELIVKG